MHQTLARTDPIELLFVCSPHSLDQAEPRYETLKSMRLHLPANVGLTIFRFRTYEFAPPVSKRDSRAGYFPTASIFLSRARFHLLSR